MKKYRMHLPIKAKTVPELSADRVKKSPGIYILEDDLFTITATGFCKIRSIIQFLESPLFALQKSMEQLLYTSTDGTKKIIVNPSQYGRPTMWDKDFLVYVISHIQNQLDDPMCDFNRFSPNHRYRFDSFELLTNIGRPPCKLGENSKLWKDMLKAGHRLLGSTIETTVAFGGNIVTSGSAFVSEFTLFKGIDNKIYFTIKLSDWIYAAIMAENCKEILTLDNDYFDISNGLKRRCYEVFRQQMGVFSTNGNKPKARLTMPLKDFQNLTGSKVSRISDFKARVKDAFIDEVNWKARDNSQEHLDGYAFDFLHWTVTVYGDKDGQQISIVNPKRLAELKKEQNLEKRLDGITHCQIQQI
jgi:Replication initiator protein A